MTHDIEYWTRTGMMGNPIGRVTWARARSLASVLDLNTFLSSQLPSPLYVASSDDEPLSLTQS